MAAKGGGTPEVRLNGSGGKQFLLGDGNRLKLTVKKERNINVGKKRSKDRPKHRQRNMHMKSTEQDFSDERDETAGPERGQREDQSLQPENGGSGGGPGH